MKKQTGGLQSLEIDSSNNSPLRFIEKQLPFMGLLMAGSTWNPTLTYHYLPVWGPTLAEERLRIVTLTASYLP